MPVVGFEPTTSLCVIELLYPLSYTDQGKLKQISDNNLEFMIACG